MTEPKKEPFRTVVIDTVDDIPQVVSGLIQVWYYAEVKSLVTDYVKRMSDGEWGAGDDFDEDSMTTDLEQTIDGHEYVIYTAKAALVCAASDHEDAIDEHGFDGMPTVEQRAYYAMLADIREHSEFMEQLEKTQEPADEDDDEDSSDSE